ncbi:MAG: EF-P lysine aminoacylase GenX [Gammaproteobacteria bacterium]|nr:EF-P lysine aminoacylase GenX [Gammaproteobacteria bacterium]
MNWQPTARLSTIRARARLYQEIRAFFNARKCLEVDTPLLSPATNTDPHIASVPAGSLQSRLYLQSSPEFAMKRLLAAGSGSIYQICHAFRDGESGRRHSREFTLLEWYRVDFGYQQLMDEMEQLIDHLSETKNRFSRISYRELFMRYTNIDIDSIHEEELRQQCRKQIPGSSVEQLDFDQCLDLLISLAIQPAMQGYVFVYDYPVSQASLARVNRHNGKVAERFELFFNGLELANGFSELTDANTQRQRFEADNKKRQQNGLPVYPLDENLLAALEYGLPECAGVALGLDRLLMVLENIDAIDRVLSFSD